MLSVGGCSFCGKVHQGLTTCFFVKFNQSISIKLLRFLLQKFIFTAFYSLVLFRANDGSLAMDGCSDRCPEQPGWSENA